MKRTLPIILGAAGLASVAATPATAQIEGLTANASLTTNYIFRGISQSANRPAVQGGLDYAFGDSGLSVGTWVSSINFGDDSPIEWDIYGNYNFMLGPLGASVGVIGYVYPYAGDFGPYSWVELDAGLSYDFGVAAWSGKAFWGPSVPNGFLTIRNGYNPDAIYFLTTGISIPLGDWLSASGNLGYQGYSGNIPTGAPSDDYTTWDLGGTITYENYSLDLRYYDTSKHTLASYTAPYFASGPFFVATFKFTFP